jgi:uncharacterized protein YukE
MKKIIRLTEKDIKNLVNRVIQEQETEEGILDPAKNVYQGLKGVWRGEGYDYYKYMSALNNVINDLKRADKPNIKMMGDLTKLKAQILSSKMPINKRNQLEYYINEAETYFNLYQTALDGIQAVLDSHLKN